MSTTAECKVRRRRYATVLRCGQALQGASTRPGRPGQAWPSGLVAGFDNPHDRRQPCLFDIQPGLLTRPSPTRQARTLPRPWVMAASHHQDLPAPALVHLRARPPAGPSDRRGPGQGVGGGRRAQRWAADRGCGLHHLRGLWLPQAGRLLRLHPPAGLPPAAGDQGRQRRGAARPAAQGRGQHRPRHPAVLRRAHPGCAGPAPGAS
jgi:hypothetical protein